MFDRDGLDGGSHNFKIVVGLQSFVHLSLIPQLFEQSADNVERCRNLRQR